MLFKLCLSKSVLKHLLLLALGVKAWLFLRRSLPPSSPKTHPPSPITSSFSLCSSHMGLFQFLTPTLLFLISAFAYVGPSFWHAVSLPPFFGLIPISSVLHLKSLFPGSPVSPIKADLPTARLAPCPAPVREVHHSSNYWFGDDSKFSESKNLSFFF